MKLHALVELEEGGLTVVVAGREGRVPRVVRSTRVPLAALTPEEVASGLLSVSDHFDGVDGVHVLFGDRRARCFTTKLPASSAPDLLSYIRREAVRRGAGNSVRDLLITAEVVKYHPGRLVSVFATALSEEVWAPFAKAFADSGVNVLGLSVAEESLAAATRAQTGNVSLVAEVSGGRARFVIADGRSVVQSRRFIVGAGSEYADADAVITQLAMELPRTLEWLREGNMPIPTSVVVGRRLGVPAEDLQVLVGDPITELVEAELKVQVDDNTHEPGLAALSVLDRIIRGEGVPSLLVEPKIKLPLTRGMRIAIATMLAVGFSASATALVNGYQARTHRNAFASYTEELRALNRALDDFSRQLPDGEVMLADENRLEKALQTRRPISRLIADISRNAQADMVIDDLTFASKDAITISGYVEGARRSIALASLATFARGMRALTYIGSQGGEDVRPVEGFSARFHFELVFTWRRS